MSNDKQINVNFGGPEGQYNVLEIREGAALPLKEPVSCVIDGTIKAISSYLEKRIAVFEPIKSLVRVDRDKMNILLICDANSFYHDEVRGSLQLSKELKSFGINSDKQYSTFELSDFIKMNRSFFESKDVAMRLVSDLRNFKAKVEKDMELSKDDRANYSIKKIQSVESNIPASFKVNIPVFKGEPATTIEVEIVIDPGTFDCSLVSPMANDIVNEFSTSIIDEELNLIKELAPGLAIIEV